MIKQVVKIGGSLFPDYAINLVEKLKNTNSLIILGGGEFANLIRKYDEIEKFSAEVTSQIEERRVGKECRSRWSPYH